jgi:predicted enzyme related to lactoylglutathione lyase
MIGNLGMIMIVVSDMERSVAFYRDALGLAVKSESPDWIELDAETVSIGLHHHEGEFTASPTTGCTIAFLVEDAERALQELRDKGADVLQDVHREDFGGQLALVADPDGYPIQLLQLP